MLGRAYRWITTFIYVAAAVVLLALAAINASNSADNARNAARSAQQAQHTSQDVASILSSVTAEQLYLQQLLNGSLAQQVAGNQQAAQIGTIVSQIEQELSALCAATNCSGIQFSVPVLIPSPVAPAPASTKKPPTAVAPATPAPRTSTHGKGKGNPHR